MASANIERENVVRKKDGLYIPKSQRSDGSWRKERKVKEGYVPPDEVPVYKTKQRVERETFPKYPAGISEEDMVTAKQKTKSQKKNEKRREKKKQETLEIPQEVEDVSKIQSEDTCHPRAVETVARALQEVEICNEGVEPTVEESDGKEKLKRVRQLRKKLKQIDDLQSRINSGELATPDADQVAKLSRRDDLVEELLSLGVDYDNVNS